MPKHEETALIERIVEDRHYLLLQQRIHVDEHIAAADQVDLGERGVFGHVVPGKHAHVADTLVDLVVPIHLYKEASQPLRRNIRLNAFRIGATASSVDGPVADIRSENL